jgi:aryl carrier-like protein
LAAVPASSAASTDQPADATAILSAIWKEVLNVDEVGLDDNFFDIGGDSIYLVDVVAMAQERGLTFTPVVVFEHPTIRSLAAHLTSSGCETGAVDKLRERALRQRRAAGLNPMEK